MERLLEDGLEGGDGLIGSVAGLQAADGPEEGGGAAGALLGRVQGLGHEEVDGFERRQLELLREHAEDGGGLAVEGHGAADDGRVGAEAALPERIRDDGDFGGVGTVLVGGEVPSEKRLDTECGQEGGFDTGAAEADRRRVGEIAIDDSRPGAEGLEGGFGVAPIEVVVAQHELLRRDGGDHAEGDEAVRVLVGQAAEEDAVDDAEDGGAGADAEGDGEDGGQSEEGRAPEAVQGVTQVLDEDLEVAADGHPFRLETGGVGEFPAGDKAGGFAAVEAEGRGQVGTLVEPGPFDGEAGVFGEARQDGVIEKVNGAGHLADLAVRRPEAEAGDPAGPAVAPGQAGFVFGDEGGEGGLVGRGGLDEQLAAGAEPAGDGAHALFELISGEEVEDVGGVDGGEGGGLEVQFAGEAAGLELEAGAVGGRGAALEFGEVGGVEVVGDDDGAGVQRGEAGGAEGGSDVENGGGGVGAEVNEEGGEGAQLIRDPAHAVAGEAAPGGRRSQGHRASVAAGWVAGLRAA